MARGREEAEWARFSTLIAFVGNRLRFSETAPILQPRDFNPFLRRRKKAITQNPKERMDSFLAGQNFPVQRMRLVDGKWEQLPNVPVSIRNAADGNAMGDGNGRG